MAGTCVDTGNPKLAVSTLFQFAANIGIAHSFVHSVLCNGEDVLAAAKITFGGL